MTMKTKKYKVSKELMSEIDEWVDTVVSLVISADLGLGNKLPLIYDWWLGEPRTTIERNNRLIALIRYVNGEDVFEVEKPKKWVVRSTNPDSYSFVKIYDRDGIALSCYGDVERGILDIKLAKTLFPTRFNTKEEAEQFTNPLMEAVEVEDD